MNPWIPVIAALLGVTLGFGLNWLKDERQRKARRRTLWTALEGDLELCRAEAKTYLGTSIDAPAYRLPTIAFREVVPKLLDDGAMGPDEYVPLLAFFHVVDQANRVLDLAQAGRDGGSAGRSIQEGARARLKMESLVVGRDGQPALYVAAADVVRRHLRR